MRIFHLKVSLISIKQDLELRECSGARDSKNMDKLLDIAKNGRTNWENTKELLG